MKQRTAMKYKSPASDAEQYIYSFNSVIKYNNKKTTQTREWERKKKRFKLLLVIKIETEYIGSSECGIHGATASKHPFQMKWDTQREKYKKKIEIISG